MIIIKIKKIIYKDIDNNGNINSDINNELSSDENNENIFMTDNDMGIKEIYQILEKDN